MRARGDSESTVRRARVTQAECPVLSDMRKSYHGHGLGQLGTNTSSAQSKKHESHGMAEIMKFSGSDEHRICSDR